ncbi:cell envelope-related transcriptional attenuator [Streptococcus criceti]|uniref:Biofilm regulatory protein A n=1 Tax=Streptococcus criceti HS-6 TaxID=873449 RepID=G5JMU8_STRCG|nr:LCP family protein [Streptococcus criceti]EHI75169.1 biofilm regulatory protein A [Streptococcus criceti HS-6]SUN41578.1 cell envelope-related transcriptional attenuator [Streptococcus criceti]
MKLGRKILLMLLTIFVTTFVAVLVYTGNALNFSNNQLGKTFKQFGKNSSAIEQTKPFSILLMGVDTGDNQRKETWEGNSDTMILVTVNPKTNQTTMTSLERDVLVNLADDSSEEEQAKLNAAYANGGTKKALSVISGLLDIDIDYYMQVNMQGLVDLVDAVGGIKVTNNFDFPISIEENEPEYTAKVEPGTHHINGQQALVYARMRYDDPEGDYGRQKRQREVIQKVVAKLLDMGSSVGNYQKILRAVSKNMQTDIDLSTDNLGNLLGYKDAIGHVKTYQLKGTDASINGGSYQLADVKGILKIQNRIKKQLGRKEGTKETLKTNAILYETIYGEGYSDLSDGSGTSDYSSGYSSYDSGAAGGNNGTVDGYSDSGAGGNTGGYAPAPSGGSGTTGGNDVYNGGTAGY